MTKKAVFVVFQTCVWPIYKFQQTFNTYISDLFLWFLWTSFVYIRNLAFKFRCRHFLCQKEFWALSRAQFQTYNDKTSGASSLISCTGSESDVKITTELCKNLNMAFQRPKNSDLMHGKRITLFVDQFFALIPNLSSFLKPKNCRLLSKKFEI